MGSAAKKSAPVRGYMIEQIEAIRSALAHRDKDLKPGVIHKARVASRRLKAALDLAEPVVKPAAFRAIIRASKKVRKRLGRIREIDVMLKALGPMAERDRCAAALAASLVDERKCRIESFRKKERMALQKAIRLNSRARQELDVAESETAALAREGLLKEFAAVRQFADAAASAKVATKLHQLRVAAKRFRYGFELADAAGFRTAGRAARQFKRIQDALGDWHDEVIFARTITTFAVRLFETRPSDATRLLTLASARMTKSDAALSLFRETWRKLRPDVIHAVEELVAPSLSRSRTDRDRAAKA